MGGSKSKDAWEGWSIVGAVAIALILGVSVCAMTATGPVDGVRAIMRMTARGSFVLFAFTFIASAAWHFWPNAWTRWQLRNRRQLSVSFALSQLVYLLALISLGSLAPNELSMETTPATWVIGGLAYLFTAVHALTSLESKAPLIGSRVWSTLHTIGSYYIWLIFASFYLSRAALVHSYIPAAVVLLFILVLRLAARVSKSRARHAVS